MNCHLPEVAGDKYDDRSQIAHFMCTVIRDVSYFVYSQNQHGNVQFMLQTPQYS